MLSRRGYGIPSPLPLVCGQSKEEEVEQKRIITAFEKASLG